MRALIILAFGLAVATADSSPSRIVGGNMTSISVYPYAVAMLLSPSGSGIFGQACGGSILNNRAILTAAHCFDRFPSTHQWRARVGSSNSTNGGVIHTSNRIIRHGNYSSLTLDNDVAIVHINGAFSFNNNVRAGSFAGHNFNLYDHAPVYAVGWGAIHWQGPSSIALRHVRVLVVNQTVCRNRYAQHGRNVTENMVCAGMLDSGFRDACQGDSGGPLVYDHVVVGVISWGYQCALPRYPGVYARVSQFASWMNSNR